METVKFLNTKKCPTSEIRDSLFKLYIKHGFDKTNRMILFPGARGINVVGRINDECNGLVVLENPILDEIKPRFRVLGVPMPYIRNSNQLNIANLPSYWTKDTKIYKCREGTNITLYHFNDSWRISSAKGLDMNDVKFATLTYQEMLDECLKNYESDWKSFTSLLKPSHSYALGFFHPDCHAFGHANDHHPDIWVNRITNLSDFSDEVKIAEIDELPIKLNERVVKFDDITPEEIIKQIKEENNNAYSLYHNENTINLGYIIRNLSSGDVLFESVLQTLINNLYYDAKFNKAINSTSYKRLNYVLLANYTGYDNALFRELFPKYNDVYNKYDESIDQLVMNLRTIYQKNKQKNKVITNSLPMKIAEEIKQNMDNRCRINVDDSRFESQVRSLLFDPANFDALYRLMNH